MDGAAENNQDVGHMTMDLNIGIDLISFRSDNRYISANISSNPIYWPTFLRFFFLQIMQKKCPKHQKKCVISISILIFNFYTIKCLYRSLSDFWAQFACPLDFFI